MHRQRSTTRCMALAAKCMCRWWSMAHAVFAAARPRTQGDLCLADAIALVGACTCSADSWLHAQEYERSVQSMHTCAHMRATWHMTWPPVQSSVVNIIAPILEAVCSLCLLLLSTKILNICFFVCEYKAPVSKFLADTHTMLEFKLGNSVVLHSFRP